MTAHETYMRTALEAAREAARLGEIPVGACIVRDGEILAVGYNTRESERDPLGHAEINAIRQACQRLGSWRLDGCVLYVTAGALSHVCRGDPQCPEQPGGVWSADPKAGCMARCATSPPCLFPSFPTIKAGCWRPSAGRNWTPFSGSCGSGKQRRTGSEYSRQILHFSPDFPQVESLQTGRNMLKYGMSDVFAVSPFPLESGLSFDDRRQKGGAQELRSAFFHVTMPVYP